MTQCSPEDRYLMSVSCVLSGISVGSQTMERVSLARRIFGRKSAEAIEISSYRIFAPG
jgi:hypothetical protein